MEQLSPSQINENPHTCVYLAHHAVLKPGNTTTKCRVVFDGSGKDEIGYSLNDRLHIGPPIQRDLLGVCLRFRQHRFVLCADIEKMFRRILVTPEHTNYQRIIWRKDENTPYQHFRLLTVTYGLASSPFLAVRVLKQLVDDYKSNYPLAATALTRDAYIDDISTGCDSSDDLITLKDELIQLLNEAKFSLHKWSSNCDSLLQTLPNDICQHNPCENVETIVKVLGLQWNPCKDTLFVNFTINGDSKVPSKRSLLSDIAKLYDPLGIYAPTTVLLKILLQESWISSLEWDEPLPNSLYSRWQLIRDELSALQSYSITRYIALPNAEIELHGFADASIQAYGAVVYSRVKVGSKYKVTLVASRTRVAPITPVSISRLELQAAHLLSRLMSIIQQALTIPISSISCWTDSEIVLHWLSAPPRTWNTFVCNRTAEILKDYTELLATTRRIVSHEECYLQNLQYINCGALDRIGYLFIIQHGH